jgi:DNA-directed RNA polymerase subunit omega
MDPHVVFNCEKVLPSRFALTLAAAARSWALARGAEPRPKVADRGVGELALREIAAGVLGERGLEPFCRERVEGDLSLPDPGSRLCDGGSASAAAAPSPVRGRRFMMTQPNRQGAMNMLKSVVTDSKRALKSAGGNRGRRRRGRPSRNAKPHS